MSANNTACSLKKLATISVPTPSQGQRRVTPARAGFYHMQLLRCVGVSELQVRRHLLEIPDDLLVDGGALEHREQGAQRFDRQPRLVEVSILLGQLPVAERRHRVQRLDDQVRHAKLLQLLL